MAAMAALAALAAIGVHVLKNESAARRPGPAAFPSSPSSLGNSPRHPQKTAFWLAASSHCNEGRMLLFRISAHISIPR